MCGIAGCYNTAKAQPVDVPRMAGMVSMLKHRGPDDEGMISIPGGCLGHTRLTIIDLHTGRQPICNESGDMWITFNGEVYNFRKLRAGLNRHTFRTATDTEVILHLYEECGAESVKSLEGMFAFALFDGDGLFMARDPLGIKPLYYGYNGGCIYFASEIRPLLNVVEEVREFPPGHWFHTSSGFHRYYDLEDEASAYDEITDVDEAVRAVQTTLEDAVVKRLVADVPLGVLLSGGLDSSIISALTAQHVSGVHSFVVGMKGSADVEAARVAANHIGTTHHERLFDRDELESSLPAIVSRLESYDKALVRSAVANFMVSEMAAEHVKVVLCGEGADELFAGYEYLRPLNADHLTKELIEITGGLHNRNLQRCDRMTMAHGLEGRVPFLDVEMVRTAFAISPSLKIHANSGGMIEKWVLRQAFEGLLPDEVLCRRKNKFSMGTGSAAALEQIADDRVSDRDWRAAQEALETSGMSKEELLYYTLFRESDVTGRALSTVGKTSNPDMN